MSQKIARYFTWRGFSSKIFNVGQVRRSLLPKNASVAGNCSGGVAPLFDRLL